ncbi:hypothetical protein [Lignipirellula cremea]|uniref:VWFA domain-containing protein n=1 Tax=Lignipirellula cremea TaxID=2528010 RepID=A0A518DWC3_9BACT|nr:hypothetical protein [Lignipirellula cremea]QDU96136.1 hypothetical protein Pla8534_39550 [Lignipirellula cremea]
MMTSLTSPQGLLWIGIAAAALLVFYTFVLVREGRSAARLNGGQTALLWLLRLGVAAIALVALARPAVQHVRTETRLPTAPILIDESLSMNFPASRENPLLQSVPVSERTRFRGAQAAVEALQKKLSGTHRVRVYAFSDSLQLLKEVPFRADEQQPALSAQDIFADHEQPTGAYSNVGDAVSEVLRDLSGEKVAGMIVLSDGRQTGGLDLQRAADDAEAAKVPVHTITLGTEFPLRDLRIDEVLAGAEASLGDVLTFHGKLNNQISSSLTTRLLLEEKDGENPDAEYREVAARNLQLLRGPHQTSLAVIPETEGVRRFRLSVPEQADEVDLENNVVELTVKVVKRTLKALLIAGEPSREFHYITPALLRDPIIELSCFLQAADVDYTQQGNVVIERLPATVKEWSQYDVAILLDVDPNGITTQQLAGLENMVSNGGGLVIIAGRANGLARLVQVHAARIRGLLPVEVDKNLHLNHDQTFDKPFHISRTSQGRNHPVLMASANGELNQQTWDTFGELDFYWRHPVQGVKPKAIALLEESDASSAGDGVLMAIQRYVDGAVFFAAVDSMWRWRYPHESYDYDRFWSRVVRYLGEARLLGAQQQVSLATDRRSYSPGEDVAIELRVLDPALMSQLAGEPIYVTIASEGAEEYKTPLLPDDRGEQLYRGEYRARRLGTMTLRAQQAAPDADSEAKPLFDVSHAFDVRMQSLENADTSADLAAMQQLAKGTGGLYLDYHTLDQWETVAAALPSDPQILTETITAEVWDGWLLLALFVGLVSCELSLRKWWGLL